MVNLSPARLSSGGAEERIAALENTVLRLRKELEYALQNLDAGNLSPTLAQTLNGGRVEEGRIVEVMEDGI